MQKQNEMLSETLVEIKSNLCSSKDQEMFFICMKKKELKKKK